MVDLHLNNDNNGIGEPPLEIASSEQQKIIKKAQRRAEREGINIRRLKRNNSFIIVDNDKFMDQATELAIKEIDALSIEIDKVDEYTVIYKDTFMAECRRILHENGILLDEITTNEQRKLREFAIQDKKKYEAAPLSESDIDILAVLRTTAVKEWTIHEACEHPTELKPSIDYFKKYYKRTEQEVIWPDQDTF